MGTVVQLPLHNRVKIREDVGQKLARLATHEQHEVLSQIDRLCRMGSVRLSDAMHICLSLGAAASTTIYGVLLHGLRAFLVKWSDCTLHICAVIDIEDEAGRVRASDDILMNELLSLGASTARVVALLTPANTVVLLGRVSTAGLKDELYGMELALAA